MQAFIDDDEVAGLFIELLVIHGEEAADIDHGVFLRGHGGRIGERAKLMDNLTHGFASVACLALLDEIGILCDPGHVMHDHDIVLVAPFSQGFQISHGYGLPACHVHAGGDTDIRDIFRSNFLYQRIELGKIHITLERMSGGWVMRLIDDHINKGAARQLLMQPCGGEVHIARHIVAILDQALAENVLCPASLMCRHGIFVGIVFLHIVAQMIKIAAARISFISRHHALPLIIAHGADAGIGQKIDIDIF